MAEERYVYWELLSHTVPTNDYLLIMSLCHLSIVNRSKFSSPKFSIESHKISLTLFYHVLTFSILQCTSLSFACFPKRSFKLLRTVIRTFFSIDLFILMNTLNADVIVWTIFVFCDVFGRNKLSDAYVEFLLSLLNTKDRRRCLR